MKKVYFYTYTRSLLTFLVTLCTFIFLWSSSIQTFSQPYPHRDWVASYSGSGGVENVATALDANGNVYVAGYSNTATQGYDFVIIKYAPTGSQLWVQTYNGPANGNDKATALTVDTLGNVYVTGSSEGTLTGLDWVTLMYNPTGVLLAVERYNSPDNLDDAPSDIAVDAAENIYVAGYETRTSKEKDYLTVKYSIAPNTTSPLNPFLAFMSSVSYNGSGSRNDVINALALDAEGFPVVTGTSRNSAGDDEIVTMRYDMSSSIGLVSWKGIYDHDTFAGNDIGNDVVADAEGNIYVTGSTQQSASNTDYVTIKYTKDSINPVPLPPSWVVIHNGYGNNDEAYSLVVYPSITGLNYVADTSVPTIGLDPDPSAISITVTGRSINGSNVEYRTVTYDSTGAFLWSKSFSTGLTTSATNLVKNKLALDLTGNTYVCGEKYNGSNSDYAIIRYSVTGNEDFVETYNGTTNGTDKASDIAVDFAGGICVTGQSWGGSNNNIVTVHYLQLLINPCLVSTFIATIENDTLACPKDTTGSVSVSVVGGTSPYSYYWYTSEHETTSSISNLPQGTYVVTVTDAKSCTKNATGYVVAPTLAANDSLQEWAQSYFDTLVGIASSIAVNDSVYVCGTTWTDTSGNDFLVIKYNPSGDVLWVKTYDGLANGDDEAAAIAVDAAGNVYVTGASEGENVAGSTGKDYVTIKYDTDGNKKWTTRYNGSSNSADVPAAIGIFNDTSIVVTGYITQTTTGKNFGTIAYGRTAGNQLWLRTYAGTSSGSVDAASSLATKDGYIFVNGRSTGASGRDLMTMKYESDGDVVWEKRYGDDLGGNRLVERDPIAVDKNSNVYASGTLGASTDCVLIKYNSAGTFQWVETYDGAGGATDQVLAMAVDTNTNPNIYLTGYAGGNGTGNDYATLAYESDGDVLWLQLYEGSDNGNDVATAIALDDSQHVYITGYSETHCTNYDFVTIKYLGDGAGDLVWTQHYNGFGNDTDMASAITVDEDGDVYVTGKTKTTESGFDALTVKYDPRIYIHTAAIESGMANIAMSILRAARSDTIKTIFYSYMDTAYIDSSHVYYYMSFEELIERANAQSYHLKDTMNKTLNDIKGTGSVDYVTSILSGLTYRETKLKPSLFIPHLEEFNSAERDTIPYIGHGFLEEDYPLSGYYGIVRNIPVEHSITRSDMHSKPSWLVFPTFPKPPVINSGPDPVIIADCFLQKLNCKRCSVNPVYDGISTASAPNPCGIFQQHELQIQIYDGGLDCVDVIGGNNYALLSSNTSFDYWWDGPAKKSTETGLVVAKKLSYPIRKYSSPDVHGDALTLCNSCTDNVSPDKKNHFDNFSVQNPASGNTGALGQHGIFALSRGANQLPLYFVLPLYGNLLWATPSPDEALFLTRKQQEALALLMR